MSAPHIERMKNELAQLADRTAKLATFISGNPIFNQLPRDERDLMRQQLAHMEDYRDTLDTRIDLAERAQ